MIAMKNLVGFTSGALAPPKGLPVILDYPWCACLETPHGSSLVSTSMRKEERESVRQLKVILWISVSPGENKRGVFGSYGKVKGLQV